MKRLFAALCVLILMLGTLVTPASAESVASRIDLMCTVNSEGDCLVTMNVTLHLEQAYENLSFPLPANARDISLNQSMASTKKTDSAVQVDISRYTRGYVGELPLVFNYTIPNAVKVDKEQKLTLGEERRIVLTIPMLCGFELPVQSLSFIINMPSPDMTNPPYFTSIYRQESVGSDLSVNVAQNQIIGSSKTTLNDHDGITMTMVVPRQMFPTVSTYVREGNPELVPILVFAGLALLYWLLFLRTLPMKRSRTSTAPEGITAGELGCRLTLCGGDLTAMVFTWAQLGYLLIHVESGRVLLHKRMDMGNERSAYENKIFRFLFGNRRVVDATGMPYARLVRKVAASVPMERNMYRGNSGNMKIFRGLGCGSMLFCGICVAMNMSEIPVLYILMSVVLGIFGAVSGWLIQDIAYRTHLRGKVPVYIGFVCILIWIVLGILCGQVWIPLGCCLGEFLFGYFAAYGGRRSDLGRHDASQVLGLRKYLKHLTAEEVNRMLANDPYYFFNMAPYALALGVIDPFSRRFVRRKMDQCPYLITRVTGRRTAEEWGQLVADVADLMDSMSRRMMIERWTAIHVELKQLSQSRKKKPQPKKKK